MNQILMRAVLELAMFLALSGDDIVNPDAAVSQLEQLASILKGLTKEERDTFVRFAQELAVLEQQAGRNERAIFLSSLPDDLGLYD
jgi:hypothetical protein